MIAQPQQILLDEYLVKLHELLQHHPPINDETRELLHTVLNDISSELGRPEDQATDWQELGSRWKEIVEKFESQHPNLVQVIDQITTTLATAGI